MGKKSIIVKQVKKNDSETSVSEGKKLSRDISIGYVTFIITLIGFIIALTTAIATAVHYVVQYDLDEDKIENQNIQIEHLQKTNHDQTMQIDSLHKINVIQQSQIFNYEDRLKNCSGYKIQIKKLILIGNRILIDIENEKPGVSSDYEAWEQNCKGINHKIDEIINTSTDFKTKTKGIIEFLKTL
ncbi:MAG: hypothetical protein LBO74_05385 [Candidatus Symbiothrix sp.]|jgi:tetrahydromethanopterin S-methyltransferase subunit G|nr:hypothetical protein [Candidatus Symbiothrix sp.]